MAYRRNRMIVTLTDLEGNERFSTDDPVAVDVVRNLLRARLDHTDRIVVDTEPMPVAALRVVT